MSLPVILVELDVTNDPNSATFTWVNITQYVLEFTTKAGRNYELGKSQTGVATLLLENLDGRFNPSNASGPYYNGGIGLTPMRRVRISATYAAVTTRLFTGYVERFPQSWSDGGNYGTVAVTAVDGFRALQAYRFGKAYVAAVTADGPRFLFTLGSVPSVNTDYSLIPGNDDTPPVGTTVPPIMFYNSSAGGTSSGSGAASTTLIPGSPRPSHEGTTATPTDTACVLGTSAGAPASPYIRATDFAIELVCRPSSIPTDGSTTDVFCVQVPNPAAGAAVSGYLRMNFPAAGATYTLALSYSDITTGTASTLVIPLNAGTVPVAGRADHWAICKTQGTVTAYLNGAQVGSVAITNLEYWITYLTTSQYFFGVQRTAPTTFHLDLQHIAIYTKALAADRVADHAGAVAARREFEASTVDVLIGRILDAIGWPAALRNLDAGTVVQQAIASVDGSVASELIQNAADADAANAFVDGQGRVTFKNRTSRLSGTPTMTFGELEQPYMEGAVVEFDDQYIANDITVTQSGSGGLVARRTNAASISRYFTRSMAKTVPYLTASDVSTLADYLLARLQAPSLRVPTLTLDMAANPTLFANLVRGIGDRVTFTRRPIGSPATSFVNVIEGITYSVKSDAFTATYLLSPP